MEAPSVSGWILKAYQSICNLKLGTLDLLLLFVFGPIFFGFLGIMALSTGLDTLYPKPRPSPWLDWKNVMLVSSMLLFCAVLRYGELSGKYYRMCINRFRTPVEPMKPSCDKIKSGKKLNKAQI